MTAEIRHTTIATNGVTLHVAQAGPEDGAPVILLHGFPEPWFCWRHQIGPLAEAGYRVLAPDQRGYNTSEKPARIADYALDVLSADVVGLIASTGRNDAMLVGHDWGGIVAWWVALRHPDRVERLAVNAPHPLRMTKCDPPGDDATPVVTHERGSGSPGSIDEPEDVGRQDVERVIGNARRLLARVVPALVGGEDAVAGLAPDQRGYNTSEKPARIADYALDVLAADVLGLIDGTGCARAALVGHDWGGIVAWWVAVRHPDRVQRLVVLNAPHPVAFRRYLLRHPAQLRRSWYAFYFQLPRWPEFRLRRANWHSLVRTLRTTSRPGTFHDDDLERYRQAWSEPGAITAMIHWYRAALRYRPPAAA